MRTLTYRRGWSRLCVVLSVLWGIAVLICGLFLIGDIKERANSHRVQKIESIINQIGKSRLMPRQPSLEDFQNLAKGSHIPSPPMKDELSPADLLCWDVLKDYKRFSPNKLSRILSNDLKGDSRMTRIQGEYLQDEATLRLLLFKLGGLAFAAWLVPSVFIFLLGRAVGWVCRGFLS